MDNQRKNFKAALNESNQFYLLKIAIHILLSVSMFSLMIPQYSLLSLLHQFCDYFVSAFSFKLFDCNNERNYMFLLCNGILVFIIKSSGLITFNDSPGRPHSQGRQLLEKISENQQSVAKLSETKSVIIKEIQNPVPEKEEEEEEKQSLLTVGNIREVPLNTEDEFDDEQDQIFTAQEEEEEREEEEDIDEEEEEEDIDEEEEFGLLPAEELHKKCEDFIRKMKEGMRMKEEMIRVVQ